jgi:hypothetical protein
MVAVLFATPSVSAQSKRAPERRDDRPPVYQRRAFEWMDTHSPHKRGRSHPHVIAPPVTSGWFQRPYPYHLDYYKMRYGGSYEPYFGNLYGPPQIVTAPPYYGPYYGNYGDGYATPFVTPQDEYIAPTAPPAKESLPEPRM